MLEIMYPIFSCEKASSLRNSHTFFIAIVIKTNGTNLMEVNILIKTKGSVKTDIKFYPLRKVKVKEKSNQT